MTIRADMNAALAVELDKQQAGKRAKLDTRWIMGGSAFQALAAEERDATLRLQYRGYPIELTDEYLGWELRC